MSVVVNPSRLAHLIYAKYAEYSFFFNRIQMQGVPKVCKHILAKCNFVYKTLPGHPVHQL